jgi:hypothetical protein
MSSKQCPSPTTLGLNRTSTIYFRNHKTTRSIDIASIHEYNRLRNKLSNDSSSFDKANMITLAVSSANSIPSELDDDVDDVSLSLLMFGLTFTQSDLKLHARN